MTLIRYAYDVTGINQTIDLLSLLAPDWLPPKVTTRTTNTTYILAWTDWSRFLHG